MAPDENLTDCELRQRGRLALGRGHKDGASPDAARSLRHKRPVLQLERRLDPRPDRTGTKRSRLSSRGRPKWVSKSEPVRLDVGDIRDPHGQLDPLPRKARIEGTVEIIALGKIERRTDAEL